MVVDAYPWIVRRSGLDVTAVVIATVAGVTWRGGCLSGYAWIVQLPGNKRI